MKIYSTDNLPDKSKNPSVFDAIVDRAQKAFRNFSAGTNPNSSNSIPSTRSYTPISEDNDAFFSTHRQLQTQLGKFSTEKADDLDEECTVRNLDTDEVFSINDPRISPISPSEIFSSTPEVPRKR